MKKELTKRRWLRDARRALGVVSVAAATALGCGWPNGTDQSVRFNPYERSDAHFARLPPLAATPEKRGKGAFWRDDWHGHDSGESVAVDPADGYAIDAIWVDGDAELRGGDLAAARAARRRYLAVTEVATWEPWQQPADLQARRNSAVDQLDACTALDEGAPQTAVIDYLRARTSCDPRRLGGDGSGPTPAPHRALEDNVAYFDAALLYFRGEYERAAEAFAGVARRFPKSEKREAALFMAALSNLKRSAVSANHRVRVYPRRELLCDDAWRAAHDGFERLLRLYPGGRYEVEARGWLGFLLWRAGDRVPALAVYFRLLADERREAREAGLASLRLVRPSAAGDELLELERRIESEPETALAYAYYELYNYVPHFEESYYENCCCCSDEHVADEKRGVFARVAALATRLAARAPRAAGGRFVLRAAMANLELGELDTAARLARRALALGLGSDDRLRAHWVAGAADHRLGRRDGARRSFSSIVAESPRGPLAEGARRHLAMIAEDAGDLGEALEQYLALDYQLDVAYLTDVLMTPEQLERFVSERPAHPRRDALWYALGVRYLRAWRFDDARRAYVHVRTTPAADDMTTWPGEYFYGPARPEPKDPDLCDWGAPGVRARWVARDIQTADDLEALQLRCESVATDDDRAEALYQLGAYLHQGGDLLFYNPEAWRGARHRSLFGLDYFSGLRLPGEDDLLWRYLKEHTPRSRALDVFLEVVDRFPRSKAAPDALYSAAVCQERLGGGGSLGRHFGSRMVTYEDVRRSYPGYQLPRGTFGWEPATRTVNGGPGWAPPPPRPAPVPRWKRYWNRSLEVAAPGWEWTRATVSGAVSWSAATWHALVRMEFLLLALALAGYAWYRAVAAATRMRRTIGPGGGYPRGLAAPSAAPLVSGWYAIQIVFAESRELRDALLLSARIALRRLLWFLLRTRAGLYVLLYGIPAAGLLLLVLSALGGV